MSSPEADGPSPGPHQVEGWPSVGPGLSESQDRAAGKWQGNSSAAMNIHVHVKDPRISFFLLHFRFWGTCEEHAR